MERIIAKLRTIDFLGEEITPGCRCRPSDLLSLFSKQFVSSTLGHWWRAWRGWRIATARSGAPGAYDSHEATVRITTDQKVGGSNPSERAYFSRLSGHPLSLHWLCKVLPRTKGSKEAENRSGLLVVYGIGSKTVDYLCLLAGLSTVAVDPQLRAFLGDALTLGYERRDRCIDSNRFASADLRAGRTDVPTSSPSCASRGRCPHGDGPIPPSVSSSRGCRGIGGDCRSDRSVCSA